MAMLYELDEIEQEALFEMVVDRARADLNDGQPLTETQQQGAESEFDKVFREMEAPNHPATCNDCGLEGTNASLESHSCEQFARWPCYIGDHDACIEQSADGVCPCPCGHAEARKPRPGERVQEFWCAGCKSWHEASVLGGMIGGAHDD